MWHFTCCMCPEHSGLSKVKLFPAAIASAIFIKNLDCDSLTEANAHTKFDRSQKLNVVETPESKMMSTIFQINTDVNHSEEHFPNIF